LRNGFGDTSETQPLDRIGGGEFTAGRAHDEEGLSDVGNSTQRETPMSFIHDWIVAPPDEFEAVVRDQTHQKTRDCDIDLGLDADGLTGIISILRGIDLDEHLEGLMSEIDPHHLELDDLENTIGTMLPESIRDELAVVSGGQIPELAQKWGDLIGPYEFSEDRDLSDMLARMVERCRKAKAANMAVIIKSFE
jgi:hypothetical protein